MTDLQSLLARVEKAEGEDRELDRLIDELADPRITQRGYHARYTASLDAALALVERVLPGAFWRLWEVLPSDVGLGGDYAATVGDPGEQELATAKTPALALLAAMLKAKIAQELPNTPTSGKEGMDVSQSQPCAEKGPQPSSPRSLTPVERELVSLAQDRGAKLIGRAKRYCAMPSTCEACDSCLFPASACLTGPSAANDTAPAARRLEALAQRLGGLANLTLHGDGKAEVAADIRAVLAAIAKAEDRADG